VNPAPLHFDPVYVCVELDPRFPKLILKAIDLDAFIDVDHAHDKVSGRFIIGPLAALGSTPVSWHSKQQPSVQTTNLSPDLGFWSWINGIESRSWGSHHTPLSKLTPIWVISMSVVLNATNVTLEAAWTKRESHCHTILFESTSQAQSVISISKIDTKDTYAYPFTKALTNPEFHGFRMLLCN
jgi:hypothetical protein